MLAAEVARSDRHQGWGRREALAANAFAQQSEAQRLATQLQRGCEWLCVALSLTFHHCFSRKNLN